MEIQRLKNIANQINFELINLIDDLDKTKSINKATFSERRASELRCKLYTYLINGICFHEALEMINKDMKICQYDIDNILRPTFIIFERHQKPQKIYAAMMMKKAGLNTKKIADVFNVSTSTILNWLKIIN